MTMRLLLEEETGSSTGHRHPHNGYYAGDFSGRFQVQEQDPRRAVGARSLTLVRVRPADRGPGRRTSRT